MPLSGEYEPSKARYARKQVELYEATGGEKGGDMKGRPVLCSPPSARGPGRSGRRR